MTAGARRRGRPYLREGLLVLAGLIVVSAAIRLLDLDRRLSALFYDGVRTPDWWAKDRPFWDAVYDIVNWPANLVAVGALVLLILSMARRGLRRHRRSCAVLVLSLLLGPGLIVNGILKAEGGRPRPRDIVEFGGTEPFHPVGSIDLKGDGKAFPSGHASMGFYFFALYILWRNSRPHAARAAFTASLAAGALIGFQRIAVGGHFLSDVIWSGGIDYLVPLCLDALLPESQDSSTPAPLRPPRR